MLCAGLILSACGSGKKAVSTTTQDPVAAAQARVTAATSKLTKAEAGLTDTKATFCSESRTYIEDIDRYGKLFSTRPRPWATHRPPAPTSRHHGRQPRQQPTTSPTRATTLWPPKRSWPTRKPHSRRRRAGAVEPADDEHAEELGDRRAASEYQPSQAGRVRSHRGHGGNHCTDSSAEATAEFNSAAFALEVAWLQLFAEAGCLTDEQQAQAVAKVHDYTVALQTELQQAGFYTGAIDGIYGPTTVEAVKKLQTDAGLPPTGLVDQATAAALAAKNDMQSLTQTAALQSVLKVAGYSTGAVDGVWTPS